MAPAKQRKAAHAGGVPTERLKRNINGAYTADTPLRPGGLLAQGASGG